MQQPISCHRAFKNQEKGRWLAKARPNKIGGCKLAQVKESHLQPSPNQNCGSPAYRKDVSSRRTIAQARTMYSRIRPESTHHHIPSAVQVQLVWVPVKWIDSGLIVPCWPGNSTCFQISSTFIPWSGVVRFGTSDWWNLVNVKAKGFWVSSLRHQGRFHELPSDSSWFFALNHLESLWKAACCLSKSHPAMLWKKDPRPKQKSRT